MRDGIHISPLAARIGTGVMVAALIALVAAQFPEARRYLKIETM